MLDKFKDECGVFGIFGNPEAANLTYLGLYALQHRGQESAGIVTADGERMLASRAMGHVADAFDEALIESISQIRGAFSLALLTKNRLIAARDPNGFRPLALGKLGDAWIVCSETCALDLIGATYVRDVEPGEVIVISAGGLRSIKAFPRPPVLS